MATLEREEYIEQAYFFRVLRERMSEGQATQTVLERIDQELLSTTRLPMAVQFLAGEVKHSGLLSSGFARLAHYFTPYQAFIIAGSEDDSKRFSAEIALLVLEREASYRAGAISPAGLFIYQFEVLCRNRLGYDTGLKAMAGDDYYSDDWKVFLGAIRHQIGLIDFADLIYWRSELYPQDQRRRDPAYESPMPPLFGEKEGKIARANHERDPLYLFAALQRQLGYPEIPQARPRDDVDVKVETLQVRFRDLEKRLHLLEAELRGQVDLARLAKPDILQNLPEDEW